MKVSWVILTYNRAATVKRAVTHCMENAGEAWDELVWVDNGSTDSVRDFMTSLKPDVTVLNKENLGVAKGYNRGMALASSDYIVITGCDMLMPKNWLTKMKDGFRKIPKTGIVSIYSAPMNFTPERKRGETQTVNGLEIQPAMPISRRMLSRELLRRVGYFHEGFGLYGWDDVVWANRAERVCKALGLSCYTYPGEVAEHLGTEGIVMADGKDEQSYHEFKRAEVFDPEKQKLLQKLSDQQWPYFNPWS